ncbi:ubiquitin carboxyl-terminal hydrolase MINDY-1 isoform X2 [Brassica napus]|uniref:protein FAM63A isoform X2 n=1 Tax=Brassica oleracea var. oleracea TaxID=109376 RepID=UPI0006A6C4DE|nr:PREDICTED: protein FAM63A isoform X2 [Brassica oleracea var. oleracea]XP_048624294.1 ubiquitin carboxyl-terminal hydrolase MINDY-1 isoform X2 [Brassica napus]
MATTASDSPTQTIQEAIQQEDVVVNETKEEVTTYKTKSIQFLGRNTPIILQNENGPCPLLAICNVLLLRNNLKLSPDSYEVSQERLMSLVVDRLIESNSKVNDKEEEYIKNQQQNIADAIDLLPRLTTGIDVNIKFRRIDDFEFTPECAIFDLLDIPLYHGWIVDPQDVETADAIGSKSYNALMGELVALETQNVEHENPGEDSVDFVAATTAALGVPSPCLSKTSSFQDSPPAAVELRKLRKGDLEEETELLQALQLSQGNGPAPNAHGDSANLDSAFTFSDASPTSTLGDNICHLEQFKSDGDKASENDQLSPKKSGDETGPADVESVNSNEKAIAEVTSMEKTDLESTKTDCTSESLLKSDAASVNPDLTYKSRHDDVSAAFTSPVSSDEPMYEGEECVNAVAPPVCADKEPVYEGESLLGKRAEKNVDDCSSEGEVIRNFLKNSASQLTFCGLFRLQEGLKERELCVFFRNNHFCTMFKYEGELYLLATDQGYLNQPDLVWEKLNEVNGDTAFMTATFKEFKIDSSTTGASGTWDEQNAVTNTADYLASMPDTGIEVNSDLQLAIALQQQEFEDQSPRSNPTPQPPTSIGASRLITGPQVPRSSHRPPSSAAASRQEGKSSKDSKCRIM